MDVLTFAILGLGVGAIYALIGQAIVVVHRGSGVLNFATAAIGMLGAFTYNSLRYNHGSPTVIAFVAAVLLSAVVGVVFYLLLMRRLAAAPTIIKIVATLGMMALLIGVAGQIFAPNGTVLSVPSLLPTGRVTFGGQVSVGEDRLLLIGIAIVITAALWAFHRLTRFGLATSAVAENAVVAAGAGWSPTRIAAATWALGSALAGVSIILITPIAGLDASALTLLVIPALAAALVGGFESWWLTLLGAMLIGVGQSEVGRYVNNPAWSTTIPLLVIVAVLVLRGSTLPSRAGISERLPSVGPGRLGIMGGVGLAAGFVLVFVLSESWIDSVTSTFLFAFVVLSIVVVSGFAGQLSLAQLELAGMGAFFVSLFTIELSFPMWLAVVAAAIATIPVGLLVAIPALRVRGTHLAISTLALASVIDSLILNNDTIAAHLAGPTMPTLNLFGVSFGSLFHPDRFAVLVLVILAIAMVMVSNLRRGSAGRRLLAVRANERASAALGISVPGVKLYAFSLAAALAGLGGALLEAQLQYVDYSAFTVLGSINSVLQGVIGGLGWVAGAPIGATAASGALGSQVVGQWITPGNWVVIITGVLLLIVVGVQPDGIYPFNEAAVRQLLGKFLSQRDTSRPTADEVREAATVDVGQQREPLSQPDRIAHANDISRPDHESRRKAVTVSVDKVSVRFGSQVALSEVSIEIAPGEVVGLIGPNGAGKTTLIDVISGFQPQRSGSVNIDDHSVGRLSPAQRARLGVSRSFQSLELFEDMTILDNLRAATDSGLRKRFLLDLLWPRTSHLSDVARAAVDELRLGDVLDKFPSEVDYARRRLVAIARTVSLNASVILLDEPAAGLGQAERAELAAFVRRLASQWGIGVLIIEHDVAFMLALCDRVIALDAGRVIASGTPQEVRNDPRVIAAYLGAESIETAMLGGSE